MKELEQRLREKINWQLRLIEYDRKFAYVDWGQVRRVIQQLIPTVANLVVQLMEEKEDLIKELEESNRELKAKLNQLSFSNNAQRDQRIRELYKQGLPKTQIARNVGMSRQGLYKALRRLGADSVNSIDIS